ncbi:MAG TPA: hypothetical protein PKO15_02155 [Fibrobacteria bacterium]|nr:hypothetical protein [Fibrobacteria bacterium]
MHQEARAELMYRPEVQTNSDEAVVRIDPEAKLSLASLESEVQ